MLSDALDKSSALAQVAQAMSKVFAIFSAIIAYQNICSRREGKILN